MKTAYKRLRTQVHHVRLKAPRRRRKPTPKQRKPSTALARVFRTDGEIRQDAKELLRRTLAKGTTDDEFKLYLWVARKHHLDPFTRQLHAVKRWDSKLNQDVMTIQVGIDGYRSIAARYPDYGSVDEPEFVMKADGKTLDFCRVKVWKKGFIHPTVAVAYWDEYRPADMASPQAFMWRRMPRLMLSKCCESLALRKAFPDLADIYTNEEMSRTEIEDYSAGGRKIVSIESQGPTPEQQQVAQQKIEELKARAKKQEQPTPPESQEVPCVVGVVGECKIRNQKGEPLRTQSGREYSIIKIGESDVFCYDTGLYEWFLSRKGQRVTAYVDRTEKAGKVYSTVVSVEVTPL